MQPELGSSSRPEAVYTAKHVSIASHCNIDALQSNYSGHQQKHQVHQTVLSINTDHTGNSGNLGNQLDHSECVCCSVAGICLSSNALRRNVSLLCNVRQVFADLQCHNEPHAQDESVWCANHVVMLGVECLNQAMCVSCQSGTKQSALVGAHHTTGSVTITNKKHRRCPFVLRLTHCGNDRLKIRQTLATTSNNIMGQACRHNKAELLQLSQQSNLKPVDR